MNRLNKKIILTGGGTGGPVAPLLAVAAELKKLDPNIEFLFVGTQLGPEKKLVESAGLKFIAMPAAKLRRYFSLSNIADIFVFFKSLLAARRIIKDFRPDLVFGAGGYVAVPMSWMAWLSGVKVALHQQDVTLGLANRLIIPVSDLMTVSLQHTAKQFPKAEWTGNPVRSEFFSPPNDSVRQKLGLDDSLPVLLVVGGATGATQINTVIDEVLPELVKGHQIIHVTGAGKNTSAFKHPAYHPFEFLIGDYPEAMKFADMIIARAGLSTISELSVLGKVAVIIPMPDSHQEDNAAVLKERAAAVVLNREEFNAADLLRVISSVKFNPARQKTLIKNISALMPHDAAVRIAKLIIKHIDAE